MKFEDILLGLIARHPASGYDLGRWLARDGVFVRANADQSQIYKALGKLHSAGLIEFVVRKQHDAPNAKVYSPTQVGIDRLYEVADSPYVPPPRWQEPDFTIRYGLFAPLRPDSFLDLIETEIDFRRAQIARFRNRSRVLAIDDATTSVGRDIASTAFEDMHEANSAALDAWLERLETLRTVWRDRLE